MTKTVAIINQKVGVGKTTTSINLSSGLAMKGKKTLLMDLDPQAHSIIGLDASGDGSRLDNMDIIIDVFGPILGFSYLKSLRIKEQT